MGEPADLIRKLEETGNVVYPVRSMKGFIGRHQIDSVSPSAVINMAHGRMGDYIVDYLTQQPVFLQESIVSGYRIETEFFIIRLLRVINIKISI